MGYTAAMRDLLIIDDKKIRREAFTEANKLLRKLDQLETSLESFHTQDQCLFNSWFELTFRDFRKRIEELRGVQETLIRFHNWIAALVNMHDIAPSEAVRILKQEEKDYAKGTEAKRRKIDEIRQLREDFIQREMREEFSENFFDDDEDPFEEFDNPRRRDSATDRDFENIRAMSDAEIRAKCSKKAGAEELLSKTVFNAESFEELELFLRIWDLTEIKVQAEFKKKFTRRSGQAFDDFLEDIRNDLEDRRQQRAQARTEHEQRMNRGNAKHRNQHSKTKAAKVDPVKIEETKILYRRLVRRLHPDLQADQKEQTIWQKKVWDRVQKAYTNDDRKELDRLWRLVLIRDRDLNALTVSEIHLGREALAKELAQLEEETFGLKKLPAWRFSKKKDHETLKKKLERGFQTEYETIQAEIRKLRNEQAYLEHDLSPY